jgi:hypothetical protein
MDDCIYLNSCITQVQHYICSRADIKFSIAQKIFWTKIARLFLAGYNFVKCFVFDGRVVFLGNNGLREAVVTDAFLFLSTFFIQVLCLSYKLDFLVSIA